MTTRCYAECGACLEPAAPCLFGWMTCFYDDRVVWRSDDAAKRDEVALTIDDVPREGMTVEHVYHLFNALKTVGPLVGRPAKATFFVIFDQLKAAPHAVAEALMNGIRDGGHEAGLHFAGRWGHTIEVDELRRKAAEAMCLAQRRYSLTLRYVRLPGGFSTPRQVTALNELGLTVVNGTAYPFAADLCGCLPAAALGACAARLALRGGRIAILHDSRTLQTKLEAFLAAALGQGLRVVTLEWLLERIADARSTTTLGLRELCSSAVTAPLMPLKL